jgi:hypothetical protein
MTSQNTTKAHCQGMAKNGAACGMRPLKNSLYCWNHDPEKAAERAQARKRGGQARHTKHAGNLAAIPDQIATIQEARQILNYALAELLAMDNGIARARALIAIFDSFVRSFEIGEIEQRLQALEARAK